MLFNSIAFLLFLPCVFLIYWVIQPRWRNIFLLLASYYFYFSYNPWFLLLLLGTSGLDFFLAKLIAKSENQVKRKAYLIASIISNIGVLFAFKYFVFVFNSVSHLTHHSSLLTNFIIPAGLSFYTFQSISYTIDVYRHKYKPDDTLTDFLLYVSFFPHMVAGPIMRHDVLMPQLQVRHYFKDVDWESFAKLTIWGFFKKMVIADNIATLINPVFNQLPTDFNSVEYICVGVLFLIQLYADFSGYSDIATGVAKLFKINLSLNWKRPLLATSITKYWQRHHISLTSWFKEYLYFSLGGNQVSIPKWIINVLLVFLISGLWHGANFTFIVWGLLNGLFYLLEHIPAFNKLKIPNFIKWVYTLLFVSIFFIAFRANNLSDLGIIYKNIFLNFNFREGFAHLLNLNDRIYFAILGLLIIILFLKEIQEEFLLSSAKYYVNKITKPAFYITIACTIFLFGNFNANSFIYFQF